VKGECAGKTGGEEWMKGDRNQAMGHGLWAMGEGNKEQSQAMGKSEKQNSRKNGIPLGGWLPLDSRLRGNDETVRLPLESPDSG
jgi:hypothetical protein